MYPAIRPQYHFRQTGSGLDAWDVRRLIQLAEHLPVRQIDPSSLPDIHTNPWYKEDGAVPSPLSFVEHMRLTAECDLTYPIILDARGRVMDGMHRVCKALLNNVSSIPAVQFASDPVPDFVNCHPKDLPYDT